jgi:hypothetical protein
VEKEDDVSGGGVNAGFSTDLMSRHCVLERASEWFGNRRWEGGSWIMRSDSGWFLGLCIRFLRSVRGCERLRRYGRDVGFICGVCILLWYFGFGFEILSQLFLYLKLSCPDNRKSK